MYIRVADTVRSFAAIVDGECDDLPEQAFRYAGTIDDVRERAAQAKALLDKGVKIEQVNGNKTLFTVSPADGSYKVNFGEEEFMNYFKEFLRPQLVEMLF